jgi:hypothetical protein
MASIFRHVGQGVFADVVLIHADEQSMGVGECGEPGHLLRLEHANLDGRRALCYDVGYQNAPTVLVVASGSAQAARHPLVV